MIVAYEEQGWKVITQRAHGLLAGQICAQWKLTDQPERWVETLVATTEHDDVFNEFERNPLIDDNGAPINFKETRFDLDCSTKLINMALTKSRFIALLIGRHIQFTHGSDPLAKQFIANLKKQEPKWLKEAGVTEKSLDMAYELLEFCDAFSLLICQSQIPPEGRRVEISSGPDGTPYVLYQKEEVIRVEPWPFATDHFSVLFEARTIKKLKFRNDAEFRAKLKSSAIDTYTLKISKL
ncbi:DUF3891 family protein [Pedobacter sp. Leaf176]|uniref:DUF3891 family protein n=1 Tax=Pedobacter sp. Leaf176 TaxID=1736286 RepID=UPI0006F7C7A8|nr:DUF3891 family protein [Pedobacter sp. Leaf176]KQR67729.1 hypothetical protein ASF92_18840 [Pedobacter sp. Leaf176]